MGNEAQPDLADIYVDGQTPSAILESQWNPLKQLAMHPESPLINPTQPGGDRIDHPVDSNWEIESLKPSPNQRNFGHPAIASHVLGLLSPPRTGHDQGFDPVLPTPPGQVDGSWFFKEDDLAVTQNLADAWLHDLLPEALNFDTLLDRDGDTDQTQRPVAPGMPQKAPDSSLNTSLPDRAPSSPLLDDGTASPLTLPPAISETDPWTIHRRQSNFEYEPASISEFKQSQGHMGKEDELDIKYVRYKIIIDRIRRDCLGSYQSAQAATTATATDTPGPTVYPGSASEAIRLLTRDFKNRPTDGSAKSWLIRFKESFFKNILPAPNRYILLARPSETDPSQIVYTLPYFFTDDTPWLHCQALAGHFSRLGSRILSRSFMAWPSLQLRDLNATVLSALHTYDFSLKGIKKVLIVNPETKEILKSRQSTKIALRKESDKKV